MLYLSVSHFIGDLVLNLDCLDVEHIKMFLIEFEKARFCNSFFCKAVQESGETQGVVII